MAFCVGQTVYAVQLHSDGQQPRFVIAAVQLAQAVNLDMADWWAPTKESYLGRVKKDQILEAIEEGTSETNFEDLRKLKKGELVAAARTAVGWRALVAADFEAVNEERRGRGISPAPPRNECFYESAITIILAGGALLCDYSRDV